MGGEQDFCRCVETMSDTMEASFSKRILQNEDVETAENAWLKFAFSNFVPGRSQAVPEEELVTRFRILMTNAELNTLEDCKDAVTFINGVGEEQLLTTSMLKKMSPIFKEVAALAESM